MAMIMMNVRHIGGDAAWNAASFLGAFCCWVGFGHAITCG